MGDSVLTRVRVVRKGISVGSKAKWNNARGMEMMTERRAR